jgi:SAM-dependent methyltransferase
MTLKNFDEDSIRVNSNEWLKPYHAPNVQSEIFRWYGQIGKDIFKEKTSQSKLVSLDYGCGEGATTNYFLSQGFEAFGIDINKDSIEIALSRFPILQNRLFVVPFELETLPLKSIFIDLVTARNVLYYLPPQTLTHTLSILAKNMSPHGILYATMIKSGGYYYQNSIPLKNGMRRVQFKNNRLVRETDILFVNNEEDLISRFTNFDLIELGQSLDFYLRSDSPGDYHYTCTFRVKSG